MKYQVVKAVPVGEDCRDAKYNSFRITMDGFLLLSTHKARLAADQAARRNGGTVREVEARS